MTLSESDVTLVTVPDVELMAVGRWYPGMSRPHPQGVDITTSYLQGLIDAYYDPEIQAPRVKLGHTSALNAAGSTVLGDAEPAFGSVSNLRISEDGMTLLGDFVNVPKWLADIMPSAYPSRSVEVEFKSTTPSGKSYDAVLTACSLLGTVAPAVKCLADIQAAYGASAPTETMTAMEGTVALMPQMTAAAAVDVDSIRRSYYDSLSGEQMWWWIRSLHIDPAELIVDDDDGTLYRVTYSIASNGDITFGDPAAVQIEYIDKPKMAASAIRAAHGPVVAVFGSRSESRPTITTQEESMALTPEILTRLGLDGDATEEQVNAALAAALPAPTSNPTDPTATGGGPTPQPIGPAYPQPSGVPAPLGTAVAPTDAPAPAPEALAASAAANGAVVIDQAAWAAHQERLAATETQLKASAERERVANRESAVGAALQAGKIPPARADHFRSLYDVDPEGTTAHLQTLQAGMIPTSERGGAPAPEGNGGDADAYPTEWLSATERKRLDAARQGVYQHAEV